MPTPGIESVPFSPARKLDYHEARVEQLLFWSRKSIPERLAAAASLTRRLYRMQGIPYDELEDEQQADLTPRRVRRQRR